MFRRKTKQKSLPTNLSPSNPPTYPVEYPSGICVHTERGWFLIQKDGKRYRIATAAILDSWSFPFIVESTEAAVSGYPVAVGKLPFREGSLLNNIADGKLYLVSGSKLRHVTDPAVLDRLGIYHLGTVVSDAEIKMMKQGEDIT